MRAGLGRGQPAARATATAGARASQRTISAALASVCPPNGWEVPLLLWHASRLRLAGASAPRGGCRALQLYSALHLYSSTALYTLHPLHPPSGVGVEVAGVGFGVDCCSERVRLVRRDSPPPHERQPRRRPLSHPRQRRLALCLPRGRLRAAPQHGSPARAPSPPPRSWRRSLPVTPRRVRLRAAGKAGRGLGREGRVCGREAPEGWRESNGGGGGTGRRRAADSGCSSAVSPPPA